MYGGMSHKLSMLRKKTSPVYFQGPNNPYSYSYVNNQNGATWENLSNILTSNNSYAYSNIGINYDYAQSLLLYDFGFAIPYGATIDGIEVSVEAYSINGVFLASVNYPLKIGKLGDSNIIETGYLEESQTISNTEQIYTFGGPSNKWNNWSDYPLTSDDINHPDFAIELTFIPDFNGEIYVDNVTMKVYYSTTADVTPNGVDFGLTSLPTSPVYSYQQSITGISTAITLRTDILYIDPNATLFVKINNGSEIDVTSNQSFVVNNNDTVEFLMYAPSPSLTVLYDVLNVTGGNVSIIDNQFGYCTLTRD